MASSDSGLETLKGVIARLLATATLTAIVGTRIYSIVPQQTAFPYVTVGITSSDYSAKDFMGMTHKIRVRGFSRSQSYIEALNIRSIVCEALERQEDNITVTGYNLARFDKSTLVDIITEEDGLTRQAIIEFEAVVT